MNSSNLLTLNYLHLRDYTKNPYRFKLLCEGQIAADPATDDQNFDMLVAVLFAGNDPSAYFRAIEAPSKRVKAWQEGKAKAIADGVIPILNSEVSVAEEMARSAREAVAKLHKLEKCVWGEQFNSQPWEGAPVIQAWVPLVAEGLAFIIRTVPKIDKTSLNSTARHSGWELTAGVHAVAANCDAACVIVIEKAEPHCTVSLQCPGAVKWAEDTISQLEADLGDPDSHVMAKHTESKL